MKTVYAWILRYYWLITGVAYASVAGAAALQGKHGQLNIYSSIFYGEKTARMLQGVDWVLVGVCGVLFSVYWALSEHMGIRYQKEHLRDGEV